MAPKKIIIYHDTSIEVWDETIRVGRGKRLWFKRPVTERDILAVKSIIDAGRDALAARLCKLREEKNILLGIR